MVVWCGQLLVFARVYSALLWQLVLVGLSHCLSIVPQSSLPTSRENHLTGFWTCMSTVLSIIISSGEGNYGEVYKAKNVTNGM